MTALTSQVPGDDYQFASVCKNHDCYDRNMVLLYAAAPPPPVAAELQRMWKAEYRRGK